MIIRLTLDNNHIKQQLMDLQGYFDDLPDYLELDIIGEAYYEPADMDYFNGTGQRGGWSANIVGLTMCGFDFKYKDLPEEMQTVLYNLQRTIEEKLDDQYPYGEE